MERGLQGYYIPCTTSPEPFQAFIPRPLPPEPPLQLDASLCDLSERANRALGRLDGITTLLPEPSLFLYLYVRKEALLSSQIEGTQSSFSDLLLYENEEAPGVPLDDVQEVSRYVAALNHGLRISVALLALCFGYISSCAKNLCLALRVPSGFASRLRRETLLQRWLTANDLGLTRPTVASALKYLEDLGIVQELTGRRRDRTFVYGEYLSILNEGTEPLATSKKISMT